MPAPWTNTAAGSAGSKARPPVPAKTRLPRTRSSMPLFRGLRDRLLRCPQRLSEILDDVLGLLAADREPDHVLADARHLELLRAHLLMRGAGGVDHQRLGVTDIGEVRDQSHAVDEARARAAAPLDAEAHHGARALR